MGKRVNRALAEAGWASNYLGSLAVRLRLYRLGRLFDRGINFFGGRIK